MIDRTLTNLFRVVTEEAAANPAFGARLEDVLTKFSGELAEKRLMERNIENFHPLVEYRKDAAAFEARLAKLGAPELRALIARHHLDPGGALKAKTPKKALAAHILEMARQRASRDAELFEY